MSKILLFVCLALFGVAVYGQTQIRFVNAKYEEAAYGLVANINDYFNTTVSIGVTGKTDLVSNVPYTSIPATNYLALPIYSFTVGQPLIFTVVAADVSRAQIVNSTSAITIEEGQSYSFVYLDTSLDNGDPLVTIPPTLLSFSERPSNPVPYGKALVRIVNVAISTYDPASLMNVTLTGDGVATQEVSIPFGEASDFLVYDSAVNVTLTTTLPISGGTLNRTESFSTVVDQTVMVYIRGDIGSTTQQGILTTPVDFPPAPPTAPVAAPTTPMASEPVSEPMTATPTAPVAPTARTPTKKVSSATQTVAQIAGVAGLMALIF